MLKYCIYFLTSLALLACSSNRYEKNERPIVNKNEKESRNFKPKTMHYGISFVWVHPGNKMVGTNNSQAQAYERPQVVYELAHGLYIGESEITADQYLAIIPSAKGLYAEGQEPVRVTWAAAKQFCNILNQRRASDGAKVGVFRLPYEFEWEYIATYGRDFNDDWWPTHSVYADQSISEHENYNINKNTPNVPLTNSVDDVKQREPNFLGVYDMLGNVSEWCEGYFAKDTITMLDMVYTKNGSFSRQRPIRGGDYLSSINDLRPSVRSPMRDHNIAGFRVLFDPCAGQEKDNKGIETGTDPVTIPKICE